MIETQTHDPDAEQKAFNAFDAAHPNNDKKNWRRRGSRRSMRGVLRGPGGRHETSTRPGERLNSGWNKLRKLGRTTLNFAQYGPSVLHDKANFERAQQERDAVYEHRQQALEAAEAERNARARQALLTGAGQANHSFVRPMHRVEGTLYTSASVAGGRHAAVELPSEPAQETFNDVIDHAENLEPAARGKHAVLVDELDLPSVPEYNLRDTVSDADDLPSFQQSLAEHDARHPMPEADADLPIFQEAQQAYVAKHTTSNTRANHLPDTDGKRDHRQFAQIHR